MSTGFRSFSTGITLQSVTTITADLAGQVQLLSSDNKLYLRNASTASPIVTEGHTATLTNKTLTSPIITGLIPSTVPYTDAGGLFVSSTVTPTELGYVSGVTSAIQTQFTNKADITLGNLGATAINAHLLPATTLTYNLGSPSKRFTGLFANFVRYSGTSYGIDLQNSYMYDVLNQISINYSSRYLADTGGSSAFEWSTGANDNKSRILRNVLDPVLAQDAATKNYVDTTSTVTLSAIGATPNANAATLTGQVLNLEPANALFGGIVTTGAQTFAGAKTFSSTIVGSISGNAATVTTNANLTGGVTSVGNAATVITNANLTGGVTSVGNATTVITNANLTGGVTSVGNATTVITNANLTGDVTSVGNASTLATVNANLGSFGTSTSIPSFTVNAKGLITAASGNVVIAPAGTLTGVTLNATVTGSSLTSVGTITSGTWTGTTIALANGGTGQTTKAAAFDALSPMSTIGDIIVGSTSGTGIRLANGTAGYVLTAQAGAPPAWVLSAASSPLTTKGDLYTYSTLNDRLPVGTNGQILSVNSAMTTGLEWIATHSAVTLSAIGAAPNANGATLTGQVLNLEPASASFGGVVTTGSQTFAGNKTFSIVLANSVRNTLSAVAIDLVNSQLKDTSNQKSLDYTTRELLDSGGASAFNWTTSGINDNKSRRLINVADPTLAQDAATKNYVDTTSTVTLSAIGATPNANGATLTGQVLNLQPADGSFGGIITTGAQTIAGAKTFSSTIVGSVSGNAATVTTNANLTGGVTSVGNATTVITNANLTGGVTSVGNATTVITNANLTGGVTSVGNAATVITNANLTGGVTSVGNAATVITNANLTGDVTSVGNATTLTNAPVIAKVLTGYTSGAGTVAATDSILQAIQKLNGNDATNANLTGPITSVGNATSVTNLAITNAMIAATTIDLTAKVTGALPIANGGTNNAALAVTAGGIPYTDGTKLVNVGAGTSGQILQSNGASAPSWVAQPTTSPLTTKGDVYTYSTVNARLPVGTNDQALVADSTQATGLNWSNGTTTATASKIAGRDANANLSANSSIDGYATIATAAGTTTLTVSSAKQQFFTGTTTQIVTLPVASTLVLGQQFEIINLSTGAVTVNSSGTNLVITMQGSTKSVITCILASGTNAASWSSVNTLLNATSAYIPPTVQTFTSGTLYTTPANVSYIRVRMVGGGGGGSGSGSATLGAGGSGGVTSFGASTANGGVGATNNQYGGVGGSASLGTGHVGSTITGGGGAAAGVGTSGTTSSGGAGGNNSFGGGGAGVLGLLAGNAGATNTGGGGSGGGANASIYAGGGGGAGGFIDAIIKNPSTTYSYVIGAAGTAGALGTSGAAGGAGAAGYIEVTEYYTGLTSGVSTMTGPTIQKFITGTSLTYTTPANVQYIRVRMVGGGSGGAGSGVGGNGGNGGLGGATTFAPSGGSLLTANAGPIPGNAYTPSAGGTSTVSAPAIGTAGTGNGGGAAGQAPSSGNAYVAGGTGGAGYFGGAGAGSITGAGIAPTANSGSGGTGGGTNGINSNISGAGGSAGGWIDAVINNPLTTYVYSVGSGGSAGTAGTSGFVGSVGAAGYIEVTEYYTSLITASNPTFNYVAKTAVYTAVASDFVDCTSGTFTITLPTAVGSGGQSIKIKNSGTGVITINTTSAQTIFISNTAVASGVVKLGTAGDTTTITSNGANWLCENFEVLVGMRAAKTSAANNVSISAFEDVTFNTATYDPYSGFSSPSYTVPIPGKYLITWTVALTGNAGGFGFSHVLIGSTSLAKGSASANNTTTGIISSGSTVQDFALGNTIKIQAWQSSAASLAYQVSAGDTVFSITRIGN